MISMQLLPAIRNYLLALAFLAGGARNDLHAQTQAGAPFKSAFELMQKKWELKPAGELLAGARANNAQAQFFYWRRETDQALQEQTRFWDQCIALKNTLPSDRQKSLWDKWNSVTDEDLARAAERGDIEATIVLDNRRSNAAYARAKKTFSFLEKSVEQGFPPAEGEAALYYLQLAGHVLGETNQPKGLELMRRSADHGWAKAQYYLGAFYLRGVWLPPNAAKAVELFQKAADQDNPRSQYELAMLYASGCGVPRGDDDAPVALLRKSAAQSNLPALHQLAERYRLGLGVSVDYVQAARYYEKAWQVRTNGGYDPENIGYAMFTLVETDLAPKPALTRELAPFAKVLSVYLKATQRHDAAAISQIGEWYLIGRFVPKDMVEAFRWFNLAANTGRAEVRKRRDEIKSKLSAGQLEQALKPGKSIESKF